RRDSRRAHCRQRAVSPRSAAARGHRRRPRAHCTQTNNPPPVVGLPATLWYLGRLMPRVRAIDPMTISKHFDSAAAEARWHAEWERLGVYRWDPTRSREESFVVDTPPPTVSG